MISIVPAILTNDLNDFEQKLSIFDGQVDWIQIDIMDGKFVHNNSIALKDISKFKTKSKLEAHLMVLNPGKYITLAKKAGISRFIFHFESTKDKLSTIAKIKKAKMQVGIAINPETPVESLSGFMKDVSYIMVMGVHPGFAGQKIIKSTISKIEKLKTLYPKVVIGIDGGVNIKNIKKISNTGVDYIAMGSGLLKSKHPIKSLHKIRKKIS